MSVLIPGSTLSNATISIGDSVSGRLDSIGDTDWYRIQIQAGYSFQIYLEGSSSGLGTLWDPYLAVRNLAGTVLAWSDDIARLNLDSNVHFVPSVSGTYFISAEESGNNATGSYLLTVWQDQLASASTAATISANSISSDRIGWGTDYSDWYAITLTAGVSYQFDAMGSTKFGATNALLDPYLIVRNAIGTILLSNDDGGNGLNSRIFFTPTVSGVYYLDIQESGADAYGGYSLIVNQSPVAGTLQINAPWQGSISFQGDFDLLAITLTGGVSYGFSINGQTLIDPFLELMDSNGIVIASDDDNGPDLNSQLAFTPSTTGTYYLAARAANYSSLGSYTAHVWELPSLSIKDVTVSEGNTSSNTINFPVTLSGASPSDISITIGTRAGTASTASGDYQGIWETTITIPAGQTSTVFSIPVGGDTEFEPNEGFGVVISNAVMATIADGKARGWIIDDDAPYLLPNDPLSRYQWYLYPNVGVNVFPVWDSWDGSGIKVAVFDQGIDSKHPDLNDNLFTALGRRASNLTAGGDPLLAADNHGTAVAGVIAAEANGYGVIGVAPNAALVSIYSTLSSPDAIFSAEISNAFAYAQSFDVLNNSWGFGNYSIAGSEEPWAFLDNFRSPTFAAAGQALKGLADKGRNGLGTVVVQSAGNSYDFGDDTNLHNFQNSRYIITVAGTDYQGTVTSYSSPGASVLIAAPGGEENINDDALSNIFTTDRVGNSGYHASDYTFINGTSFSGPVVSGVVALMLDANPTLGYRDVQQIIAYSGRRIAVTENVWKYNGAFTWNGGGLHYDSDNHNLGFGLIDALTAVRLAESWSTPSQTSANDFEHSVTRSTRQTIPDGTSLLQQSVSVEQAMEVERVEVTIDISHTYIGDLEIVLTSPAGTNSKLLSRPGKSESSLFGQSQDNINFTFNTVLSWGESSVGVWKLSVFDRDSLFTGTLNAWTLNLIGKPSSADDVYVYTNEFSESVADQTYRSTLTDSGGIDQINASAVSTATSLNLQAGSQSTIDGRALSITAGSLIEKAVTGDGNDAISGNQAANHFCGMRGNDSLSGGEGNDSLEGGQGNDLLEGGLDIDLAIFNGLFSGYRVERFGTDYRIVDISLNDGDEGADLLYGIEEAKFSDATVQLASLDLTPPNVSIFNPADGTGSFAVGNNISITFSENIQTGGGNIEIRQGLGSGTLVESFNVDNNSRVAVSGSSLTIDPTNNLSESVQYFVVIPTGAIRDLAGNSYAGINTYDFTANASPIATGSSFTTNEDTGKTGALAGTDVEGSTLTFAKLTDPSNGTVTINASTGAYTYTPNINYNGSDSFTFNVNDGTVDSTPATVSITVAAVNDTPVATAASATTNEDTAKTSTLAGTDVDGNTLTFTKEDDSANGTITINATTGAYTYTPKINYNGSDSFTFKVNDGTVDSAVATVSITLAAVNDAPLATADSTSTDEDTAKTGKLGGTDVEGSTLTFAKAADPSHGTVTVNSTTGAYTYTPAANYNGSDSFTFKVNDGTVDSSEATFSLIIGPVNDTPTGSLTISGIATQGQTLTAANTLADVDGKGAVSYQWQANGTNISGANEATYTLTQAQVGKAITVVASYTDEGGTAESVASAATDAVSNINDRPTITSGTATSVIENSQTNSVIYESNATDLDPDDSLIWTLSGTDASLLSINRTGQVTLKTFANFEIKDKYNFNVVATDLGGLSASQAVVLSVNDANDAPTLLNTLADQRASQNLGFRLIVPPETFADEDALDNLSYSALLADGSPLPNWLRFSAADRAFSGTPSEIDIGRISVTLVATDSSAKSVNDTFSIEVIRTTTAIDVIAYTWKSHTLLSDIGIEHKTISSSTDALGKASLVDVALASDVSVQANRAVPSVEDAISNSAVNLQDAIAILKMIVGLPVNAANQALSPYQSLAADFDGDGQISLNDAIGVLKHVVGLSSPAPTWHFVDESSSAVLGITDTPLVPGPPPLIVMNTLSSGSSLHLGLVGYLSGDVDGSFVGLSTANDLDLVQSNYFEALTEQFSLKLSQFGIYA